jgi:hypothetical protein
MMHCGTVWPLLRKKAAGKGMEFGVIKPPIRSFLEELQAICQVLVLDI